MGNEFRLKYLFEKTRHNSKNVFAKIYILTVQTRIKFKYTFLFIYFSTRVFILLNKHSF